MRGDHTAAMYVEKNLYSPSLKLELNGTAQNIGLLRRVYVG